VVNEDVDLNYLATHDREARDRKQLPTGKPGPGGWSQRVSRCLCLLDRHRETLEAPLLVEPRNYLLFFRGQLDGRLANRS
jgi:hypothetical protein